jgi:HEAT repeat protein/putative zinc finger protein
MNLNCRDYQHQITLLLYDELAEGARPELEAHLRECADCQEVFESEKAMHVSFAEDTASWDVPSELLVESRRALANELDRIEKKRSWWRMPAFSVVFTPMRLLESAALVAMGLALGVYVSNQQVRVTSPVQPAQDSQASTIPQNGTISNLQVVNSDPSTGQVELAGQVSQPIRFQGRTQDGTVRQLLFNALRDAENPGSRLKAVEVLSQTPKDETVEEALINALVYDEDAGVRSRALEGLKQFADEQHVRAAFMHTLQNDDNAGIRKGAIDALLEHNAKDPQLGEKLQEVTKRENNPYIRQKVVQLVGSSK